MAGASYCCNHEFPLLCKIEYANTPMFYLYKYSHSNLKCLKITFMTSKEAFHGFTTNLGSVGWFESV